MKLSKKLIGMILVVSLGGAIVGCSQDKATEQDITAQIPQEDENTDEIDADAENSDENKVELNEEEENKPAEESEQELEQEPEKIKTEVKPEQKPEVSKQEQKPETSKPETKPVQKPETSKPEVKPEQKPEASKPEAKPEQKPEESKPVETTGLSASELYDKVVTSDLELPSLQDMDSQFFADTYGVDTSLLKSYKVKMPMMMVHASEIAIFELNDASNAPKVIEGINKRVEGLKAQWGSYLPDQLELVQNYKTATKGNYVIFVVSEYADTIISNFNTNVR